MLLLLPVAADEWSSAVAQMAPLIFMVALSGGDQFTSFVLIPNPITVGSTSTGSVLVGCRIAFVDVQVSPSSPLWYIEYWPNSLNPF